MWLQEKVVEANGPSSTPPVEESDPFAMFPKPEDNIQVARSSCAFTHVYRSKSPSLESFVKSLASPRFRPMWPIRALTNSPEIIVKCPLLILSSAHSILY